MLNRNYNAYVLFSHQYIIAMDKIKISITIKKPSLLYLVFTKVYILSLYYNNF